MAVPRYTCPPCTAMPVRVRVLVHRRCHLARSVRRDLTGALEEVPTEVQPRLTRAHHVDLFGRALADVTDPHVTGRCVDREPPRVPQTFRPELRSHVGLADERVVGGDVVAGLGQLRLDAQDRAEQLRHVLGVAAPAPAAVAQRDEQGARRVEEQLPALVPETGLLLGEDFAPRRRVDDTVRVRVRDDVRRAVPVVEVQEHAAVARVERDAEQALLRAVLVLADLSAQIEDLGRHAVHDPVDASGLGGDVSGRVAWFPCHRGRLADVAVHRRQPDRDRFERRDGRRRRQRGGRCRRRGRRGRRRRRRRVGRRGRRGSRRVVVSSARAGGEDQRDARCRDPVPMCVHAAFMRSAPRSCCRCRADLARTIPGAALQSDVPNWGIRRCGRSENLHGRDVRGYGSRIRDDGGRPRRRPADSPTHATSRSGPGGRPPTCAPALHPRHRRPPRGLGARGARVPPLRRRRVEPGLAAGWVLRRRGVLRRQRLPDHVAAARRAHPDRLASP